jgi:lipopolysaccharide/colanic/teichoic acid biosynthesis glycosyltransferase
VLRAWSLDELPQLYDVLRGEMSLVGPRPLVTHEVDLSDPRVRIRLQVKPGVTGLWQVAGRHRLSFDDLVRYDLFYIENWSLSMDLRILPPQHPGGPVPLRGLIISIWPLHLSQVSAYDARIGHSV